MKNGQDETHSSKGDVLDRILDDRDSGEEEGVTGEAGKG